MAPPSPDVARARFAAWVDRTVRAAYARRLTVRDIEQLTGVGSSTLDRWRSGEGGTPKPDRVNAFADGLGVSRRPAHVALGWIDDGAPAAPEPELDPDVRAIARLLADPKISDAEKDAVRLILRRLAPAATNSDQRRAVS